MTEQSERIPVNLVRTSGEFDAVVEDPATWPWPVVETSQDAKEPATPVDWAVIIYVNLEADSDAEAVPFVFESEDVAKAWVERHNLTNFNWETPEQLKATVVDKPEELSEQFCKIAAANDVPDDSAEAIEFALADEDFRKRFSSLVFYPGIGRVRTSTTPPYPIPSSQLVSLPWPPASLSHRGSSDMWSGDGKLRLSLREPQTELDSLPFPVVYAYTA